MASENYAPSNKQNSIFVTIAFWVQYKVNYYKYKYFVNLNVLYHKSGCVLLSLSFYSNLISLQVFITISEISITVIYKSIIYEELLEQKQQRMMLLFLKILMKMHIFLIQLALKKTRTLGKFKLYSKVPELSYSCLSYPILHLKLIAIIYFWKEKVNKKSLHKF